MASNVPNLTTRAVIDTAGSTADQIYADAVLSGMHTLVVDEYNLLMRKEVPGQVDAVVFPVMDNFDLTWTDISGTGSDTGSDITVTEGSAVTYRKLTPVLSSAAIFVTDAVDLLTNKADFELYAKLGAQNVGKKIDQDAINNAIFAADNSTWIDTTGIIVVGTSYAGSTGSVGTGSYADFTSLSKMKATLTTGSNPRNVDTILMHPNQHSQLITSSDLRGDTYRVTNKARFNANGDLEWYDGCKVVVTELVNAGTTGYYSSTGHPVAIFDSRIAGALATKMAGFGVSTVDDRLKHGKYKIFDIMFKADVLVAGAIGILRCVD